MNPRPLLAVVGLSLTVLAQTPTDATLVLSTGSGAVAAQVLAVDGTGVVSAFGRFPSDTLPPLAITVDPFDRQVLVAVALPNGSRVLRLLPGPGLTFTGEVPLVDLPGACAQLEVDGDELHAVVGGAQGGIYRLPRRGGPALLVPLPRASALAGFGGNQAIVAWAGSATPGATDPGLVHLDLGTGAVVYGPFPFPNLPGRQPTGLIDLPTALSRQLVACDDGSFWLHVGGLGNPTPVAMTPPLPPGGAQAFKMDGYGFSGLAVGGAAYPHLYRADWTGVVTVLATLPGSPVDLAPPLPSWPQVLTYGAACGSPSLQWVVGVMGPPQLGNLSFDLRVLGAPPGQPVVFVLGLRDDVAGGVPLPLPLPGGCLLQASPDVVLLPSANAGGLARQSLPIPNQPALAHLVLFAQWLLPVPGGVAVTSGAAVQLGR